MGNNIFNNQRPMGRITHQTKFQSINTFVQSYEYTISMKKCHEIGPEVLKKKFKMWKVQRRSDKRQSEMLTEAFSSGELKCTHFMYLIHSNEGFDCFWPNQMKLCASLKSQCTMYYGNDNIRVHLNSIRFKAGFC